MSRIKKPRVTIDQKARAGYIDLDGSKGKTLIARTKQVHPGVLLDIGWLGQVVGIELLYAGNTSEDK